MLLQYTHKPKLTQPHHLAARSYRTKHVFVIAAFVCALLVIDLIQNQYYSQDLLNRNQSTSRSEAFMVSTTLNWYINEVDNALANMGTTIAERYSYNTAELTGYLRQQRTLNPHFRHLVWQKPDGIVAVSVGDMINGLPPGAPLALPQGMRTNRHIRFETRHNGHTYVAFAYEISRGAEKAGTLLAYLDPQQLLGYLPLPPGPKSLVVLYDSQGHMVAQWGANSVTQHQLLTGSPLFPAFSGEEVSVRHYPLVTDNLKVMGVALPIQSLGWVVFAGIPEMSILKQVNAMLQRDMYSAIVIGLIMLMLAMSITTRASRNIAKMKLVANAVAAGDKNQRVEVEGRNEFASMGTSFNHMLDRIQALETELDYLYTNSPDLIFITDMNGKVYYVNPAFTKFLGITADKTTTARYLSFVHPDERELTADIIRSIRQNQGLFTLENRVRSSDGTFRWVLWKVFAAEDNGRIYCIGSDTTKEKQIEQERVNRLLVEQAHREQAEISQRRFAFLAEASTILSASLDYPTTLKTISQLSVPHLADWCEITILEENDSFKQFALAYDPSVNAGDPNEIFRLYPWRKDDNFGPGKVIRTGEPQYIADVRDIDFVNIARSDDHLERLRKLQVGSFMCIPLVVRGNTIGAVTLARLNTKPRFTREDFQLAMDIGQRSALALDNARLYGEARDMENRLRNQLDFTHAITDNMLEGLCALDVNDQLLYVNPAALHIFGDITEEQVREFLQSVMHQGHHHGEFASTMSDVFRTNGPLHARETYLTNLNGSQIVIEYSAAPMYGDRKYTGCVCVFQDITERKQAEAELCRAQEERDLARTRFLQVAAHELRNPMTGVKGIVSLLRRRYMAGKQLTNLIPILDAMEKETDRLSALLTEILEAFRVQEGQLRMVKEPVDIAQVATAALYPFRLAEETDRFVVEDLEEIPVWILGDSGRLEEVVRNLLSNAIKYSPKDGLITLQLQATDDEVTISVGDQGMGIPEDQLSRVFETFFRASNLAGRDPGGIGLGLFICKDIVERHGGRIWVESAEGNGSTFYVRLPRHRMELQNVV